MKPIPEKPSVQVPIDEHSYEGTPAGSAGEARRIVIQVKADMWLTALRVTGDPEALLGPVSIRKQLGRRRWMKGSDVPASKQGGVHRRPAAFCRVGDLVDVRYTTGGAVAMKVTLCGYLAHPPRHITHPDGEVMPREAMMVADVVEVGDGWFLAHLRSEADQHTIVGRGRGKGRDAALTAALASAVLFAMPEAATP